MSSLDPYTVLYSDTGIAVVVPEHEKKERRRAAQTIWDDHVGGGSHLDSLDEFSDLMAAGEEQTWGPVSDRPDRWAEGGDLSEAVLVYFFHIDDIPGSHAWSEEWLGVASTPE